MAVLRTNIDPGSEAFRANEGAMRTLVEDLRARVSALTRDGAGGDERSIARHRERGKLPVRERRTACTRTKRRAPASSPASAAWRASRR
jgi:3-methylcrotonyl-CoA carboxylase beta subunit